MNESKMCNYCNKVTDDEIVKGEVFCIECGHQRDTSKASLHQEGKKGKKKEWWKSWWYIGIWFVVIYFLFPAVNNFVKSNNKVRQIEQAELLKNRFKNNMGKLSAEEAHQLTDFATQVYYIEISNLNGQDKEDYARLRGAGDKLTIDEGVRLTALIQKAKNSMSLKDKKFVEEFEQKGKAMLK